MPHANIIQRTRHKLLNNALTERYAAIKAYFAAINAELLAAAYAEGIAIGRAERYAAAYAEGRAEGRAQLIQELIALTPPDASPEYREWLEQLARNNPANR